ncbi:MAG: rhomboid family intramembrane serine protease [Bacteroidota bacterium]
MKNDKSIIGSALIPVLFVILLWVIHFTALEIDFDLTTYGLYPRKWEGLFGIVSIPFIHGSWSHLINNSIPLLVLGWALFYFYPTLSWKTIFWIWLSSGIWLWISGRASYHIGASGIVYGLAAFLFLSGWLRQEKRVASLSLLIAFLYGSMWWGVLPVDPTISWEGHLWGALAGFVLAWVFRKEGIQKQEYQWDEEEEIEDDLTKIALGKMESSPNVPRPRRIVYVYKEKPKPEEGSGSSQDNKTN